jgi:hypothetical protein
MNGASPVQFTYREFLIRIYQRKNVSMFTQRKSEKVITRSIRQVSERLFLSLFIAYKYAAAWLQV